jgi:predicted GNAT family acetyltransferase
VRTLVASIRARGETAFLHALADNTTAIRLYELLGFRLRRGTVFSAARGPMNQPHASVK